MDISTESQALAWVEANKKTLTRRARKYLAFAPYVLEDYLQDARLAAIEAFRIRETKGDSGSSFHAYFWLAFRARIAEIVPLPGTFRTGTLTSHSIPSTWMVPVDVDWLYLSFSPPDISAFLYVLKFCSPRARRALTLHLEHKRSISIAMEMGVSPRKAKQYVQTALRQIRSALTDQKPSRMVGKENNVWKHQTSTLLENGFVPCAEEKPVSCSRKGSV